MRLLAILAAIALVACIGVTSPDRDPHCIYPRDTVGVFVVIDSTHRVKQCAWIVADSLVCFNSVLHWRHARCTIGDTNGYVE